MADIVTALLRRNVRDLQRAQLNVPEATEPSSDERLLGATLNAWWAGLTPRQRLSVYQAAPSLPTAQTAACDREE